MVSWREPNILQNLIRYAEAYFTLKIHKDETPLIIIINPIRSTPHNVSKWLYSGLKYLNRQPPFMDAKTFIKLIQGKTMKQEECMVSFNVIFLFPLIPINLAKELMAHLMLGNTLDVSTNSVVEMFIHFLSYFYMLDDEFFKQHLEIPMGSSIAGVIADAGMQSIEAEIMKIDINCDQVC